MLDETGRMYEGMAFVVVIEFCIKIPFIALFWVGTVSMYMGILEAFVEDVACCGSWSIVMTADEL